MRGRRTVPYNAFDPVGRQPGARSGPEQHVCYQSELALCLSVGVVCAPHPSLRSASLFYVSPVIHLADQQQTSELEHCSLIENIMDEETEVPFEWRPHIPAGVWLAASALLCAGCLSLLGH